MSNEPTRFSDRPISEIIDFEYGDGVSIEKIMSNYEEGMNKARWIPSVLEDVMGVPHDRRSALAYANKLIDQSAKPHGDKSLVGTFYRILDEAGMLDDAMTKASPEEAGKGLKVLLDVADADQNGIVTPRELKIFMARDKNEIRNEVNARLK